MSDEAFCPEIENPTETWLQEVFGHIDTSTTRARRGATALAQLIDAQVDLYNRRLGHVDNRVSWFHVLEAVKSVRDLRASISEEACQLMLKRVLQRRAEVLQAQDEWLHSRGVLTDSDLARLRALEPEDVDTD
jgi:hypothetical protein